MDDENENTPLVARSEEKTVIYKRRWWILSIFSFSCFMQNLIWNTWGPIAQSAKEVFNWSDSDIGMLPNCGNIAYILAVFFASYLMDEKGLRISAVSCSGLIFIAAGVRCITSIPEYATWLMFSSEVIDGIAGTVFFSGPPLLASIWFPPNQRTTATAVSTFFNYAGLAGGFLVGPLLVSSPTYNHTTEILSSSMTTSPADGHNSPQFLAIRNLTELTNLHVLRNEIMWLMYIECIAAGFGFLCTMAYFPDKPPKPPSNSATIKRTEYKKAICQVLRNGPLWLITIAFALPIGVYGVWGAVLDVILNPVNISQVISLVTLVLPYKWIMILIPPIGMLHLSTITKQCTLLILQVIQVISFLDTHGRYEQEAGWIGFYSTIGGCFAGLIIARFSDLFMKHMKLFLICLYLLGGGSYAWFTLICERVIPFSTFQLYMSSIIGGLFLNATIPLFFELSCETSYPVAEGITGGLVTVVDSLFGVVFLFILQIPNIGTVWMNWVLVGSIGAGLLFLLIYPESYRRTELDITVDIPKPKVNNDINETVVSTTNIQNVEQGAVSISDAANIDKTNFSISDTPKIHGGIVAKSEELTTTNASMSDTNNIKAPIISISKKGNIDEAVVSISNINYSNGTIAVDDNVS